jgi:ketosteroid isomerase-like protein
MSAQSVATDNAAAVRRGYQAFQTGDVAILQQLFAPDLKWHVSGRSRMAGTFEGAEAVLRNFGELASETGGTFGVQVHDVLASDDHVVVLASFSADRAGKHVEGNYCHVCHLSAGRITESWIVDEDPYAVDEFWA